MATRAHSILLVLLLAACSGGGGGGSSSTATPAPPVSAGFSDNTVYSSASTAALTAPSEFVSVTRHQLAIGGQTLNYTATVGHLSALALGTGAGRASFFYVAYTLDGAAPATRPVTFFYNGGPGSATVWLHLGSFGPQRLATGVPASDLARPFALVPNTESLLDVSDLVFVDAVGSGFSEAIAPNTNRTFWGVDDDAEVFRDFVMRYSIVNGRAASPKFLYGESYGGPRSGVLADMLEAAGVHVTGVVLQSPAMNYNSNCGITTVVSSCGGYLPSYGAVGAWFRVSTPSPAAADIPPFMAQLRTLTTTRYSPALAAYVANLTPMPDAALLTDLSLATGMSVPKWQSHFNMGPDYVRTNLIANTLLGRYDARITQSTTAPNANNDPSDDLIGSSFAFRITEYLAALGYTTPSSYTLLSSAIQTWRFSHDGNSLPDTIPDLAAAMMQNPRLKVLAVNGYHDLATPFFTTENDLARLGSNPNVTVRDYMGGHMTYLDDTSRGLMKADIAAFYRSALAN